MEKSTGGVSFDIRFIDSGDGSEKYSSVESRRLIGSMMAIGLWKKMGL